MKHYLIISATDDRATTSRLRQLLPTLGHTDNWMANFMILRHRGPAQRIRKEIEHRLGAEVPFLVAELTGNLAWSGQASEAN